MILLFIVIISAISCKNMKTKYHSTNKKLDYIPYYLKVYEADSLHIIGEHEEAYKLLDSVFKVWKPVNMRIYREYETYLKTAYLSGNKKNLYKKTRQSFVKYGSRYELFSNDSIFKQMLLDLNINKKKTNKFAVQYSKTINKSLRDTIEKIIEKDQQIRKGEEVDFEVMRNVAKENEKIIKYIFEKYGYPNNQKIGYYNYNERKVDLLSLFAHFDEIFVENYLSDKLREFVIEGECEPIIYAGTVDRYLLDLEGKQLYGTYLKNYNELMPLKYPKKLDSIRRSIGLYHVNYDKWRLKEKYNVAIEKY